MIAPKKTKRPVYISLFFLVVSIFQLFKDMTSLTDWLARIHLLVYRGSNDANEQPVSSLVADGNDGGFVASLAHDETDEAILSQWDSVRDNLRWNYGYVLSHSRNRLVQETSVYSK